MASTKPVDAHGMGKPPGEDDNALRRHKWLVMHVADVAVGMCWALSPEEYEDMGVSTTQVLESNEHGFSHGQHRYIHENLPSWIEDFKAGPERREHPNQHPDIVHTRGSTLSRPSSPDLKWPLTREERIQELDELYPLYSHTPQARNIIAAKKHHSQFPADQIVSATTVTFMESKQIDESEVSMYSGQPRCEGSGDVFMTGSSVYLLLLARLLAPSTNITGGCESTYATRA